MKYVRRSNRHAGLLLPATSEVAEISTTDMVCGTKERKRTTVYLLLFTNPVSYKMRLEVSVQHSTPEREE
ncbi:hypothetical protein Pmani_036185 [Petrolisthes manimaculis]|uniref:Uncharacterized protein n=1 Tax=Petrolisthes manimaculis TaxID=1843537 RepID=A0AAE1NJ97_9EUCA|nr:hypothetical protein Pmani_036185 [Petrolisthes manimaculis]